MLCVSLAGFGAVGHILTCGFPTASSDPTGTVGSWLAVTAPAAAPNPCPLLALRSPFWAGEHTVDTASVSFTRSLLSLLSLLGLTLECLAWSCPCQALDKTLQHRSWSHAEGTAQGHTVPS